MDDLVQLFNKRLVCNYLWNFPLELLKTCQEYSNKWVGNNLRYFEHDKIKRQIGEMLGKPDVDWFKINKLEELIAEYRCLTPYYYTERAHSLLKIP